MELNTLGELMRDETQDASPPASEIDRLVAGALRRGRRTVVRQRVAAAVACCALLITGAAVAVQIPGRTAEIAPVAPTSQAGPPTVTELLTFFQTHLPDEFGYSEISDDREPMAGEIHVSFTLTDPAGESHAGGGINSGTEKPRCEAFLQCRREPLAGGTLLSMRTPPSEVVGEVDEFYYLQRLDGRVIWFSQGNSFPSRSKRKEITRPTVPLSRAEVRALLTAPAWDPLVARCAAAGPAC
jgi:hypothetical protein